MGNKHEHFLNKNDIINETEKYTEWQFDKAEISDEELDDMDRLISANLRFIRNDYKSVIDLLDKIKITHEHDQYTISKIYLLLAVSHAHLWLQNDPKGNAETFITFFSKLSQTMDLGPNNQFLYCRILVDTNRVQEAQNEFVNINLDMLEAPQTLVASLDRKLNAFDKKEMFIKNAIEQEPDNIDALSIYCELLRSHLNKFSESIEVIEQIEKHNFEHDWAVIQRGHNRIDLGKLDSAAKFVERLPTDNILSVEVDLFKSRLALANKQFDHCVQILNGIQAIGRFDYIYLMALAEAEMGETEKALKRLETISESDFFENKLKQSKAMLLFSLGN